MSRNHVALEPVAKQAGPSSGGLSEHQIRLIEESFAAVAPKGEQLVAIFYQKLFTHYPGVKPLFAHVDFDQQRKKLLASLVLVVNNLRKPEKLLPALDQLGVRHVDYSTKPQHYPAVGRTLLESLAEVAGDLWGTELEEAWATAYGVISSRMMAAASGATKN